MQKREIREHLYALRGVLFFMGVFLGVGFAQDMLHTSITVAFAASWGHWMRNFKEHDGTS